MNRIVVVLLVMVMTSCGRADSPTEPLDSGRASERLNEYALKGVVVRLDADRRRATIRHQRIEGFMDAMTMDFPIPEGHDFDKLRVNMGIEATLYQRPLDSRYWIGQVRVTAER